MNNAAYQDDDFSSEFSEDIKEKYNFYRDMLRSTKKNEFEPQIEVLEELVEYCIENEKMNDALIFIKVLINILPESAENWHRYSLILHANHRNNKALEAAERSIELNPYDAEYWLNQALILDFMLRTEEAMNSINHAISLDSSNEDIIFHKAFILQNNGDYQEAVGLYLSIKSSQTYKEDIQRELIECYTELGNRAEVLKLYDALLQENPLNHFTWVNFAKYLYEEEMYLRAINAFEYALVIDESDFISNYYLGLSYIAINKPYEAQEYLVKAEKINPNYIECLYTLAINSVDILENRFAIRIFNKILRVDPNYIDAYHGKGVAYYNLKEFTKAITVLKRYIKLSQSEYKKYNEKEYNGENIRYELEDKTEEETYGLLALAYIGAGQLVKALPIYEKFSVFPENSDTRLKLVILLLQVREFEKAEKSALEFSLSYLEHLPLLCVALEYKKSYAEQTKYLFYLLKGFRVFILHHLRSNSESLKDPEVLDMVCAFIEKNIEEYKEIKSYNDIWRRTVELFSQNYDNGFSQRF